jgi:dipeptidyl aminopeptidase/acylaminoacyl peptidase
VLSWTGYIFTVNCSPDGKWIAFAGVDKRYGGSTSPNLWIIPNETGLQSETARNLTAQLDRPVGHSPSSDVRYAAGNAPFKWRDEQHIVFHYGNCGSTCIGQVNVDNCEVNVLWQDPLRTASAFDLGTDGRLVMQIGCPTQAEDLYLVHGTQEQQLTNFNGPIYEECLGAPCQRLTFSGDQDWEIDGWLLTPPSWDGQTPLPTVLIIHGGPHGSYGSSFMFQAQIQAANGIAVFYTNPRGSQGYGQQFAYAVVGDWAGGDYSDLMLGVDHLVAKGLADESKLGIMGWSYGGFMTSWAITQTNRFKAALPGAIISNRHSFYGSSDIGYYFGEHQFEGNPWNESDKLLERSAINFADQVDTPALFMHGENDLRCPIEQTDQFFTALRRQAKLAVMVRYPSEFHGISQPQHKEDRYQRVLAWFKHYLV